MERSHVGIATIREREASLFRSIQSLREQTDKISVYLNDYAKLSSWMESMHSPKLEFILSRDAVQDLGDAGKFYPLLFSDSQFYLTADDDITYPSNYVEEMTRWAALRGAVCVHGRIFPEHKTPISHFFGQEHDIRVLHFADALGHDTRVHVAGTGTLCFRRDGRFRALPHKLFFRKENMADLWTAIHCLKENIPLYSIPRKAHWLTPTAESRNLETLFDAAKPLDETRNFFNAALPNQDLRLTT